MSWLGACEALWLYEGEARKSAPHALLHSGQHSDGYADVGKMLREHPEIRWEISHILSSILKNAFEPIDVIRFDQVVGADTSSTLLAKDVAEISGARHIEMVETEDGSGKRQVWSPKNEPLRSGDVILHIEELITTASSALEVRAGIRLANPDVDFSFAPYLPTVVERSDPDHRVLEVEESVILPALQLDIRNYRSDPETCLYCRAGSEAVKPKVGDNWARLNAR